MSTARPRRPPRRPAALAAVLAAAAATAAPGCATRVVAPPGAEPAGAARASPPGASPATPPPAAAAPRGGAPATAGTPAAGAAARDAPAPAVAFAGAPAAPELTVEQMRRRSPSAALVEAFDAACAEPARGAVRRAAKRLDFAPVEAGTLRDAPGGEMWRGPAEVGGAVLVWDEAASACELRAEGVNLLLVEAAFSRLPQALEEGGASVMRLAPPIAPSGGVRTRQMLLVQPGASGRPEHARVLRLGHRPGDAGGGAGAADGGDAVTLSARAVSAPPR